MKDKIKNFLINYIEKKGELPKNINLDEFNYIDSGYIDSMGIIKFTVAIEKEFDIEISEEEIISKNFKTIGGLCSIIEEKIK